MDAPRENKYCLKTLRDFFEISRLINLNFDIEVIVTKSISFIADQLKKRVRIYLLDDRGDLVIKQWAGDYKRELSKGIVVLKSSIVWKTFEKGEAINITREEEASEYIHTLKNKIAIKSVIPIKYKNVNDTIEEDYGVMVIDSGPHGKKISDDDFFYSVEMATLIGQAIARAKFFNRYRQVKDSLTLMQEDRIKVLNLLVHELRNPLTVIGGFTKKFPKLISKIYDTVDLEQRHTYLDKLLTYSKIVAKEEFRIEESINDFIKFVKVIDPKYKINISTISLQEIIKEIVLKYEPLSEIKNIETSFSKKEIFLEADKEGVFTVLNNLVENAINFSPENSRVTIFSKEGEKDISFSVRSETFIERKHRKDIFDFYYKIVGKEDKGTGLGLAVAKKIIENHRGTIKVISKRRKQGRPFTRFVVTLPKKLEMYGV